METRFREEEQGLYEILRPLIRRWKLITGGILVGIIFAVAVSLLLPKQYETTCLLNIGMAVDKSLEDPYTVTKIISSESFQQTIAAKIGVHASAKQLQKMIQAETDTTRWTPWVNIRVVGNDPQTTLKLANAIADGIIQRHAKFFDEKMQRYQDFKRDLERNIDQFTQEAVILQKNLNTFRANPHDLSTEMLLQTRLSEKENQAMLWRRDLRDVSTFMSEVHSRKTSLVTNPVLPNVPTKPNLKLNLMIAVLVSTFLMISFVLLLEQYRKGSLGV